MNDKTIKQIQEWASDQNSVQGAILTSSRVRPEGKIDLFSDYDVEFYVNDLKLFTEDRWINSFGEILIRWPLKPEKTMEDVDITRLVLFEDKTRIDFQIIKSDTVDPERYRDGYYVLVDKIGLFEKLKEPTYDKYYIQKPTEEEFTALVNDFFWDATYIVKNLWREELFFAKYMFDVVIRFEYLQKMLEWNIASKNNWAVDTGKHGRHLKEYLSESEWTEIGKTFAGSDIEQNWDAFFNTLNIFRKYAQELAVNLNYAYPEQMDEKVKKYFQEVRDL